MANQFVGQVFNEDGSKLEKVKVTITGIGMETTTTETDANGNWVATIEADIDPKSVTVSFSKPGLESSSITNPQQTAVLSGYIDPIKGGILDLAGKYPSGKWKISSLPQDIQDIIDKEIEDAYNFAKSNQGNFTLEIESSESKVPNNDKEGTGRNFDEPGSLAKARALELEKYVNDKINTLYAKETNPSFQKPTVVLGKIDNVGGDPWDGKDANAKKYTDFQFTRLKANLIRNKKCDWIPVSTDAIQAGKPTLIKGIGASYIELDAAVAPDVFIISGKKANGAFIEKQSPVYYQSPESPSSPISWGIILYMSDIARGTLPQYRTPLQTKTISINEAVNYISDGYSNKTYSDNITQLLAKKNINIPLNATFEVKKNQFLIGLKAYFPSDVITYYTVERSYYKFPLIENGINGDFEVKAISGLLAGGSAFNYKMCV